MKLIGTIAVLAALAVIPVRASETSGPPFSAPPKLTGVLTLGGATPGARLGSGDAPTSLVVEGQLRLSNVLGGLSLNAEGTHCVSRNGYYRDKSEATFGVDVPLGRNVVLFGEWTRRYRVDDDWTLIGARFSFGG